MRRDLIIIIHLQYIHSLVLCRNPAMRTARNVFIVNLAVSDLMLCLITMPLTLVEILYMTWQVNHQFQLFSTLKIKSKHRQVRKWQLH